MSLMERARMNKLTAALAVLMLSAACGDDPAGPAGPVPGPLLLTPALGDTIEGKDVTFTWEAVTGADSYTLQYSSDSTLADSVELVTGGTGLSAQPGLTNTYWWRVRASIGEESSDWSDIWHFYLDNPCARGE